MSRIDELLAAERERGGFSAEQRADLWRGIERATTGASPDGGDTDGDASSDPGATTPASAAHAGAGNGVVKIATWKLGALLAAVALGGGAVGFSAHAQWAPEPPATPASTPEPSSPEPSSLAPPNGSTLEPSKLAPPSASTLEPPKLAPPSASTLPPARSNDTTPAPPRTNAAPSPAVTPSMAPAPAKDPSLARERTLLDMARTALARGSTADALAAVDTHAREFPTSQLAEEREVLAVQALDSAGRTDEAKRRATSFRSRWPRSPLIPIVDEASR